MNMKIMLCDLLHWHNGEGAVIGSDGVSFKSICSRCNRKVLQDSQGNWFRIYE